MIEKLTTDGKEIQREEKWDKPSISIEHNSDIVLIKANKSEIICNSPLLHDQLIDSSLGPLTQPSAVNVSVDPELASVYANLLTDLVLNNDEPILRKNIRSVLKGLQPYREKPSKDRSKRFAAGDIPFNSTISEEHDLVNYSYWCIKCMTSSLQSAKVFLLGQVLFISQEDKPVDSSMSNCPSTSVVLYVYKYDADDKVYTAAGRSALLKANKLLIAEVIDTGDNLKFDHSCIPSLSRYSPFQDEVDLNSVVTTLNNFEHENEDPYMWKQ